MGKKQEKIEKLKEKISKPSFWDNAEKAREISQELGDLEKEIGFWQNIDKEKDDLLEFAQMLEAEGDSSLLKEVERKYKKLNKKFVQAELEFLMSEKYDRSDAILMIHAGSGGVDAQDWAEMLMRMYLRYIENRGWKARISDKVMGNEAGIKSVTIEVTGKYAFGYLRAEGGTHRLVRQSPFDADHARHTSFALVEAFPVIENDLEIEIRPEDLKIDTFRASGAGGQSVNKTSSAVRITYLKQNIVVSCQTERSQRQNKETAIKILKSKLYKNLIDKSEKEKLEARGEHVDASWGNQIRSYVLHPYKMVKDHRTKLEVRDTEDVLNGNIQKFIEAFLKSKNK